MRCEIVPGVFFVGSGRFRYTHAINCNIYAIVGASGTALIDTGCGFGFETVIESLTANGIDPDSVSIALHTHADWDHARGAASMKRATGCEVAIHEHGVRTLEVGPWFGVGQAAPPEVTFEPVKVDRVLRDGDEVDLGDRVLRVLHTPGHTADSVCFEVDLDGKRLLFSGDTVEAMGRHGIATAETDFRAYRDSVTALAARGVDVLLPGHGIFILEEAGEHIEFLAQRLSSKWVDVAGSAYPPPFDSGVWYYRSHPELLEQ